MNLQGSKLGSTRPLAWFSCRFSVLVGTFVLLSYALSYVHLAVCSHAITEASGKVTHSSGTAAKFSPLTVPSPSHEEAVDTGLTHPADDECKILPLLKQGIVLARAPQLPAKCEGCFASVVVPRGGIELRAAKLFRLAPSRSPPLLG